MELFKNKKAAKFVAHNKQDGRYFIVVENGVVTYEADGAGCIMVEHKYFMKLLGNMARLHQQVKWLFGEADDSVFDQTWNDMPNEEGLGGAA